MTDRPILDIQLDTSAFDAFRAKFDAYRAKAGVTAGVWAEIGKTTSTSAQALDKMATSLAKMQAALGGIAQQTEDAGQEQEVSSERWTHIASSAKAFGSNIKDASLSLAKWSGLTGLFAGILSAGGLYGISRMAAGVGARRSQAMSYGSSYGEFQSYQTNFARLGNSGGLLAGFNEAMTNAESRGPLYALMGAGADKRLAGKSAAGALAEALPDIKRFVDSQDPRNLEGALHGTGLDRLGVDMNTALTIRGMSPQELGQISRDFAGDQGGLGLSPELAKNWQDFDTALDVAGAEIENHFATNLVNLAPSLTLLADGLSHVVDHMLKDGGPAEKWLARANKGIEDFAKSIGKKETTDKVDHFVKDVGAVGRVISQMVALHGKNGDGAASLGGIVPDDAKEGWNHSKANRYMNWLFGLNSSTPEQNQRASDREAHPNLSKGRGMTDLRAAAGVSETVRPEDADQTTWRANYMGGPLPGPSDLTTISGPDGQRLKVNKQAADSFGGFIEELRAAGAPMGHIGSYSIRRIAGSGRLSQHAYGNALDIGSQSGRDIVDPAFRRWVMEHPNEWNSALRRWHMIDGGKWKHPDLGHVEWAGPKAAHPNPGDPDSKLSPIKTLHPHLQGQTNTVHVDDETGGADVHKNSRAVGPMTYGTDFGRFGH